MNYSFSDILKSTNYYIEYNFINDEGIVKISWLGKEYKIKYDNEKHLLISDYGNLEIECDECLAGILTNYVVRAICADHDYDYSLCLLKYDSNITVNFMYKDITDEKMVEKAILLNEIYMDILNSGLRSEHVDISNEYNIFDSLNILVQFTIGVSIEQ